jgi:hypothetical protein
MNLYFRFRLTRWIPLLLFISQAAVIYGQTAPALSQTNRPFETIVSIVTDKPLEEQYRYILRLIKGLTPEPHLGRIRSDLPSVDDLVRELVAQKQYELMYALLSRRETSPENYLSIANVLAKKLDSTTFQILLTNSSPGIVDAAIGINYTNGTNIEVSEGIPEFSCALLGIYYLQNDSYHDITEIHLIGVLKNHRRTGARAEAAHALRYSNGAKAIVALERAISDKGYAPTSNGPYSYVYEYAEDSLRQIKARNQVAH